MRQQARINDQPAGPGGYFTGAGDLQIRRFRLASKRGHAQLLRRQAKAATATFKVPFIGIGMTIGKNHLGSRHGPRNRGWGKNNSPCNATGPHAVHGPVPALPGHHHHAVRVARPARLLLDALCLRLTPCMPGHNLVAIMVFSAAGKALGLSADGKPCGPSTA